MLDRPPVAAAGTTGRVGLLLSELLALVMREPDAVEYDQAHVLKALTEVAAGARAAERRRRARAA